MKVSSSTEKSTPRAVRDERWSSLMIRAQEGDKGAYQNLLKEVADFLNPYFLRKIGSAFDVDDLIQEVLIGMHHALQTYDRTRSFTNWILAIARYKSIDHFRRLQRRLEVAIDTDELAQLAAPEAVNNSIGERLGEVVSALPEKQRKIIELVKLKGFSMRQAANFLGMTEGAAKVAAHRAYRTLRERLQESEE